MKLLRAVDQSDKLERHPSPERRNVYRPYGAKTYLFNFEVYVGE